MPTFQAILNTGSNLFTPVINTDLVLEPWTEGTGEPAPTPVTVILIDGQSNAFGDGPLEAEYALPPLNQLASNPLREFQRVKIWNPIAQEWQKLQAGVNSRSVVGQADGIHVGAEIGLAYRWEEDSVNNGKTLYILKYAINGANIEQWLNNTGPYNPQTGPEGYGAARDYIFAPGLAALEAANLTPVIKGITWNQWESNSGDSAYASKLTQYFSLLVADGFLPNGAKFVVVGAKDDATILAQQQAFVNAAPNRILLDGASLSRDTANGDNVHINGAGQLKLGRFLQYDALLSRVSPRPQEATLPVCDDTANTFAFTPNPLFPNPEQWSFKNEATGVVTPIPSNTPKVGGKIVYTVGDIVAPINTLSVYVTEQEGLHLSGVKLYNNAAFTGTGAYTGAVATSGNTYLLSSAPEANLSPGWNTLSGGTYLFNANPSTGQDLRFDLSFEIHFDGTGISLSGLQNGAYGGGTYTLDGGSVGPVSFNSGSGAGVVLNLTGLSNSRHVLRFLTDAGYCTPGSVTIL